MNDKFLSIIKKNETILEKGNKIFNIIGYAKIITLPLLFVHLVFVFSMRFPPVLTTLCGIFMLGIIALWVFHSKLHEKIDFHKGIVDICNRHLARISGEWTGFRDTGAELAGTEHPYARDLDIVGAKSLFQLLNTTHTWFGRLSFARDLLMPSFSVEEISRRQAAIAELNGEVEFTSEIQYHLSQIGINPLDEELAEELADNSPFISNIAVKFLFTYMPIPTIVLTAGGAIFQTSALWLAGLALAGLQMVIWGITWRRAMGYIGLMSRLPYKLGKYTAAINTITAKNFTSKKLKDLQSRLNETSEAIIAIEKISNRIDVKHNAIIYFAMNAFLLWDCHCAFLLEGWKRKYSAQAGMWFEAVAEFESLMCFSHLPNICNNACLPEVLEFSQNGKGISAAGMGHPLLPNKSRVNNDLRFDNDILIISGSNMSGKTTFMRTVGINLILARAGSYVCAEQMSCAPFDLMTSMRISDDLNEGISTFYAELKRIKGIIDAVRGNSNMLFLIDEIFKGTNSVDRLAGAEAVISQLEGMRAVGMISTHDLELCKLAEVSGRIKNFSFSEHYKDGRIYFDYKLKPGQSKTTNAKFLMEMVGIYTVDAVTPML